MPPSQAGRYLCPIRLENLLQISKLVYIDARGYMTPLWGGVCRAYTRETGPPGLLIERRRHKMKGRSEATSFSAAGFNEREERSDFL